MSEHSPGVTTHYIHGDQAPFRDLVMLVLAWPTIGHVLMYAGVADQVISVHTEYSVPFGKKDSLIVVVAIVINVQGCIAL